MEDLLEERVEVENPSTGITLVGDRAPHRRELGNWLCDHPGWRPKILKASSEALWDSGALDPTSNKSKPSQQLASSMIDSFDEILAATVASRAASTPASGGKPPTRAPGSRGASLPRHIDDVDHGDTVTFHVDTLRSVIAQKMKEVEARVLAVQARAVQEALESAEEKALHACRAAWRDAMAQAGVMRAPGLARADSDDAGRSHERAPGASAVQTLFRTAADEVASACLEKAVAARPPPPPPDAAERPPPPRQEAPSRAPPRRGYALDDDDDFASSPSAALARSSALRAATSHVPAATLSPKQRTDERLFNDALDADAAGSTVSSAIGAGSAADAATARFMQASTMAELRGQQAAGALRQARAAAEAACNHRYPSVTSAHGDISQRAAAEAGSRFEDDWQAAE